MVLRILLSVLLLGMISCGSLKRVPNNGLVQYDSLTHRYVYTYVEKMPEYKGGDLAFISDFAKTFRFDFKENESLQTRLHVQFVIDKEGHLIGERIYNKKEEELTRFEKEELNALKSMQNWESGKHNGENVDVIVTLPINVDSRGM